ncbi:tetratricopeptide repeat-containing sensor histidine kinase [Rufibacter ruber]|uniref:tetratricopeptide repeat-containing sensor histidine kinase n=1 Tax=Rufibacter ruber TaxID=1783499 RepID=UPI00082A3893|nr:tetratricopeptide repeat-containing sensor histidine kinase [Rufibacter ruber]
MRFFPILVLLFFLAGQAVAQQSVVDSLQTLVQKTPSDSLKVVLLNKISEQYTKFDPEKAVATGQQAEKLATRLHFLSGQAAALNYQGVGYMNLSEYGKAMRCHQRALQIRRELKDSLGMVSSLVNLGNVNFRNNDFDKSMVRYQEGLVIAEKIGDKLGMSRLYNNMGSIYEDRGDNEGALAHFLKAAKMKEELGDRRGLSVSLYHLGVVNANLGNIDKAFSYLHQALKIDDELQNTAAKVSNLRKLAELHQQQKDYPAAIKVAKQSLELASNMHSTLDVALSADLLQDLYAAQKQYKDAYDHLLIRTLATDTLHSERRREMAAEAEAAFENEKKELENQKLKLEQTRQQQELAHQKQVKWLVLLALGASLGLAGVLFFSRRRSKIQNRALREINARVQAQNYEITLQKEAMAEQAAVMKKQRDELEKLNTFKNKIFSIISHDLRSPFASVQALFYLADANAMNDQEFKRLFKMLGKDYENASNLLDNLLIWAKNQITGASVQYEKLNLHYLAGENVSLLAHNAEMKQIELVNEIPEGLQLSSDRERLNFVIRNLVMNAIKFTQPGGTVCLQAKEADQKIVLQVKDTGTGISPKVVDKLFSEQRFSSKGTYNEKGTGLGLMLCKELLEGIGGTISVESQEGSGSTFSVALPKKSMAPEEPLLVAATNS